MALKRKTAPSQRPVTIEEVKQQCHIDHADDDALLTLYMDAAVAKLDGYSGILGRCLITQEWELYYDAFPCGDLKIPLGDLIAVVSVEYIDPVSGLYVAWDASNYEVDAKSLDGWIIPVDSWPTPMDTSNAVRVTFTAGYGAAAADVPAAIRSAMLMQIGQWNQDREGVSEVSPAVTALLAPFRRVGI